MNYGDTFIRIGFGILFLWGGLEKLFEGFLGGVGLHNMAEFLQNSGWSFLGSSGTYILALVLALMEILAGLALILERKVFPAYSFLAFIMLVALVTVHIPSGNWMMIMIHIALITTLTGLALQSRNSKNLSHAHYH